MVSIDRARDFVHANGTLWERALWDYLFDGGSLGRVHQCLLCYKNADRGWGHGLERDLTSPQSNSLMLEFLLTVVRDTGFPVGNILDGTPRWVESAQRADGLLDPPPGLLDYPHSPWWEQLLIGAPDSIAGNLTKLGLCPPAVQERTRGWVMEHLGLEQIRANEWLFMAYHAFDYYMNADDFPDVDLYRAATLENIYACALAHEQKGELHKLFPLFQFADGPDSIVALHAPDGLIDRVLDHLQATQREDGGWDDEHGLATWQPYFSTVVLLALQRFGRLD